MEASSKPTVLLIEDTMSLARLYEQYLSTVDVDVRTVETGREGLDVINRDPPDLVLLDISLPDINGLDILRHINDQAIQTTVVVITANGSINVAVEAMRDGAYDFLVKPFNAERLRVTVKNGLERRALAELVDQYKETARGAFDAFIGGSPAMQAVYKTIEAAAHSKATVFIEGESGTGKELCAVAVHRQSTRAQGPFIAINCGAIPRELMESEIFGHRKGSFTGAHEDRDGAASLADGGTLFLDEICEMDLDLQTKLLRFIQTGTYQRVGDPIARKVDVRFVCATNKDAMKEVEQGRFREDLYYRLHVIPITMPPLRDRGSDTLEIARRFLIDYAQEEGKAFQSFDAQTAMILGSYSWPGNVRQLQNIIRNIVVLNDGELVTPEMLPAPLNAVQPIQSQMHVPAAVDKAAPETPVAALPRSKNEIRELWEVEKETIENAIDVCGGNIPQAAGYLGIAPSTIYRKRASWQNEDGEHPTSANGPHSPQIRSRASGG
ncbi:sigma-54-dependent transcriptional regulator [Hwanghaeella sp.]|uniref:sigma-54-dependent transcriptional regulator n=1 Tax=Hwanghaeella sp. TaxID=2605943 RepID=UPI003CCBF3C1